MNRKEVINEVRDVLAHLGFFVSESHTIRSISFDIVARRDDILLIIKALGNVDAFSKENAKELQVLANLLQGSPFIIGSKSSSKVSRYVTKCKIIKVRLTNLEKRLVGFVLILLSFSIVTVSAFVYDTV